MRLSARNYILGLKKRAEIIGSSGVMKIPWVAIPPVLLLVLSSLRPSISLLPSAPRIHLSPRRSMPLCCHHTRERHTKCFHARFQRLKYLPSFPMLYLSSCFAFRVHLLCLPPHLLSIVRTPVALRSLCFETRSHTFFSSCTSSLVFYQYIFLLITYAVDIRPTHYTILILYYPFDAPFPSFGFNFLSLGYLFVGHSRSPAPTDYLTTSSFRNSSVSIA